MTVVFADTFCWVALAHPHDAAHQDAVNLKQELDRRLMVTTDDVLVEYLNYFSEGAPSSAEWQRNP
jgi:predicted nucleic acid-binding protein